MAFFLRCWDFPGGDTALARRGFIGGGSGPRLSQQYLPTLCAWFRTVREVSFGPRASGRKTLASKPRQSVRRTRPLLPVDQRGDVFRSLCRSIDLAVHFYGARPCTRAREPRQRCSLNSRRKNTEPSRRCKAPRSEHLLSNKNGGPAARGGGAAAAERK